MASVPSSESPKSSTAIQTDSANSHRASTEISSKRTATEDELTYNQEAERDVDEKVPISSSADTSATSDNETEINTITKTTAQEEASPESKEGKPTETTDDANPPTAPVPPYSAFSQRQKWTIVVLASFAAIFGPISSNIYVPAIPEIVDQFHESTSTVDLTLTIYLVFQAIAPSFLAGLSDYLGRRLIMMTSLSLYIIACIGIALTPSSAFWLLMIFRALQAIGGSPSIATGAGVMGDIATPAERGRYVGMFQGMNMIGPAFGPVLGGILVQYLSWRWIFWLLSMWCGTNVICIFFFMPETLRALVGNGSIAPPTLNRRPMDLINLARQRKAAGDVEVQVAQRPERKPYKPFASWHMLLYPEVLIVLFFGSFSFACMFASLTVLSSVLSDDYGLDNIHIGLCYLPQGLGSMTIGLIGGRFQDWYFRRMKRKLNFQPKHHRDLDGFPIERVRFAMTPYYLPIWVAACISYGFMLQHRVNLAGPLVVSYFIGAGTQFSSQTCQLILVDMFPSNAGASAASSNLIRCTFSAIMTAAITHMTNAMGLGWTFVVFVSLLLASCPFLLILISKGQYWRRKRAAEWNSHNN